MNSRAVVVMLLCSLLALQMSPSVEGICFRYVCRRRCIYRAPRYEEYAFRYLWPKACGRRAVQHYNIKACCVTWGRY